MLNNYRDIRKCKIRQKNWNVKILKIFKISLKNLILKFKLEKGLKQYQYQKERYFAKRKNINNRKEWTDGLCINTVN